MMIQANAYLFRHNLIYYRMLKEIYIMPSDLETCRKNILSED